jgi:hypothetical protein
MVRNEPRFKICFESKNLISFGRCEEKEILKNSTVSTEKITVVHGKWILVSPPESTPMGASHSYITVS